jgi:opacity protein-like surface antigen
MNRIALTTALIAAVTAGAASAQIKPPIDPAATTFTGWVRISHGEFQLYGTQREVGEAFSRPCVSGALPRGPQRVAADLNGQQVTFTGKAVAWADRGAPTTLNHQGSRIVNECRGDYVITADSVRVLRAG